MDNIKLGEFILKRRKALDLGQKELSDALFVSIPTISKWEKGTRYPDLALLGELAKILKVDIESLCEGKEQLNNNYDLENEFNIESFSKHFKYLRKLNDLSLQDLAVKLNVRYQTISKWENTESLPTIFLLIECAKIFNVSISELYYGRKLEVINNEEKEIIYINKLSNKQKIINFSLIGVIVALIISLITVNFTYQNKLMSNNEIKVTYDFDEFINDLTIVVNKGEKIEYYSPNIEGYTLKYYLNEEEFDFNTKVYENIILKGVFVINTYTVNFYNQDHDLIKTEIVEYNKNATPPEVISYDDKYKFYSWSLDYKNVKSNLDIYPLFVNNEADITFELNGGVCDIDVIYEYDESKYDLLPTPNKKGYTFIGWYYNDKLFTKNDIISAPIVLVAKYKPIQYEITLNLDGGKFVNKNEKTKFTVDFESIINLPIPNRNNEIFVGWYYKDDLVQTNFKFTYTSNIELIAKYSIASAMFEYIENINDIEIIKYKGKESFVEIPSIINGKKVTSLSTNAFSENFESVKELKLPKNINKYGKGVLNKLVNLEKLWINQSISTTLVYLFDNQFPTNFDTIVYYDIDKNEHIFIPHFYSDTNKEFNVILDKNSNISVVFMISTHEIKNITSLEYSNDYGDIFNISSMDYLKRIILKGNFNTFRMEEMPSIEHVELPDSIIKIDNSSFKDTPNLKYVKLPKNLSTIEYDLFYNSGIKEIIIPENVIKIEKNAFYNCTNLTDITIPQGIYHIEADAFYNCTNLKNVYYDGTLESWKQINFDNMYSNPLYYADNLYINGEKIEV